MRAILAIACVTLLAGTGVWWSGWLQPGEPIPTVLLTASVGQALNGPDDMAEAVRLIQKAKEKFADVKDYRCTFLRDEYLDGALQANHIKLSIRHEPFSVHMEWLGPKAKKGRQTIWVDGQNNGKMLVKQFVVLRLDPQQSIERKESRHVITEAGLRNSIERFHKGWEREKQLGQTKVDIHEGDLKVNLGDREVTRPYRCVSTTHRPEDRELFTFYKANVYFDRDTGLPIRIEGYDWPKDANDPGNLVERFTYLDLELNVGLTDKRFSF